jgi:superfamily II DNA or RNA helicase
MQEGANNFPGSRALRIVISEVELSPWRKGIPRIAKQCPRARIDAECRTQTVLRLPITILIGIDAHLWKARHMGGESLSPGTYELVITQGLKRLVNSLPPEAVISEFLPAVELPDRLSQFAAELVKRTLNSLSDDERLAVSPRIINHITEVLLQWSEAIEESDLVDDPARVLHSIGDLMPDRTWSHRVRPLTPLADTTLLTGSRGEPTLLSQLRSEIPSADSIDILVAFIRQTGMRPLLPLLREHTAAGKRIRILTTTYTGSTEGQALDQLAELGAEIKVSYDVSGTRLHAKSWLFKRASGLSTAYVGSSNLTFQAQVTGLEWNVRLSAQRNSDSVAKLDAVFESYWAGGDFIDYSAEEFEQHSRRQRHGIQQSLTTFDLVPHPFQRRMLDQLALCREQGRHRNLVVSATGTGKTILSAFDYQKLRSGLPSSRLLYVAHRLEILEQSLTAFRNILQDPTFGELWVGGRKPQYFNHVFASIQTISNLDIEQPDLSHFDVVIIDEFHHAASKTYRKLLDSISPLELIGLTATPERSDGQSILHWFDDQIAVELRLWDAIEQQRLVPFLYYGIDDDSDLTGIPRRGREYDQEALGLAYQSDARWVGNVIRETKRLTTHLKQVRGLGFCASVSHAAFTAKAFELAGIPSAALSGNSSAEERKRLLADLRSGQLAFIFSVDVLSEGIDLPNVNTVLFLRPTESATVFIQQLGRGLRKAEGKDACLVLDFIGTQASDFRFDLRYRAVLGSSRKRLEQYVQEGFPYLPAGCQINLDQKTTERVLKSLRKAIPTSESHQTRELVRLTTDSDMSLCDFLDETGLEISDIFRNGRSWMTLRIAAGLPAPKEGSHTARMRRAMGRMLHIEDELRLSTYAAWIDQDHPPPLQTEHDIRLMRMLLATLTRSIPDLASDSIINAARVFWIDRQARADLHSMLQVLARKIASRGYPVVELQGADDVPLRIHARYTRDEILCALGCKPGSVRPPSWQSGVWLEEAASTDLFAFTLDKSAKSFSPSTRYRDYAISDTLIHWESQGKTRASSSTGQRYMHHLSRGSKVYLFARESVEERSFWFLGPANYVSHVGERPMAITWRLVTPLHNDLFGILAAAA